MTHSLKECPVAVRFKLRIGMLEVEQELPFADAHDAVEWVRNSKANIKDARIVVRS